MQASGLNTGRPRNGREQLQKRRPENRLLDDLRRRREQRWRNVSRRAFAILNSSIATTNAGYGAFARTDICLISLAKK
jgi:hypothetical protein